jgi:hypothetical protein
MGMFLKHFNPKRFPSYNRVTLPAVKTTLYHPETSFGSIQKNQNDNHLSKFPIDNVKSSTNLDHGNLKR